MTKRYIQRLFLIKIVIYLENLNLL